MPSSNVTASSFATRSRPWAKRRLAELREKVTGPSQTKNAGSFTFEKLTDRWLETVQPNLKLSSHNRWLTCVENLEPFFKDDSLRNISARKCDARPAKRGA